MLRHIGSPGLMQAEVLSFTRLADRVVDVAGGGLKPYINQRGRAMAVGRLLMEHQDKLQAYGAYARSPHFAAQLAGEIAEFKRFRIPPERLAEADASAGMQDISLVFNAYTQTVGAQYADSEDRLEELIERVPQAGFLQGASIFIDGFEMLTAQVYALVEALLECAHDLNITFRLNNRGDTDAHIFRTERKHLNRILTIGETHGLIAETVQLPIEGPWGKMRHDSGTIAHLERSLFTVEPQPYEGEDDGGVALCYAENMDKEVELCAQQLRALARTQHYRWRDMMVVCQDIDLYASRIKRIFKRYDIACFIDDKRSVDTHSFAQYCIYSLQAVRSNFAVGDVVNLMKTGFSPLDKASCDELEHLCIASGTRWLTAHYEPPLQPERFAELRRTLLTAHDELAAQCKQASTYAQYAGAFYTFLEQSGAVERLEQFIAQLQQQSELDAAAVAVQVHEVIVSVLQQAHDLLGQVHCDTASFCTTFVSGLEAEDAGIIPTTIDSVACGSVERSRAGDIKALFMLGVNEGVLPGNIRKTGLVTDRQMERLSQHDIYLGHNIEERAAEQSLALYTAVSKPSRYLYLSCALVDGDGKALAPYVLMRDVQDRLPGVSAVLPETVPFGSHIGTYASTALPLAAAMRDHQTAHQTDPRWADVYHAFTTTGHRTPARIQPQDDIDAALAQRLYGKRLKSSASQLETFALCPFRHFVSYGLRPEPKPTYGQDGMRRGTYYHDAAQRFIDSVDDWAALTGEQADKLMDTICDDLDKDYLSGPYAQDGRERSNARTMRANIKGSARAIMRQMQQGRFHPLGAEVAFAHQQDALPEYIITLPTGQSAQIQGRIDRIDEIEIDGETYVRLIDYKSGNNGFDYTGMYYGTDLQLPLYSGAVSEALDAKLAGMFIMPLREGIPEGTDAQQVEEQRLRSHRLKGLLLGEDEIIAAMDGNAEGSSSIIPVTITSTGKLHKNSNVATAVQMQHLIEKGKQKAGETLSGIFSGQSKPYPLTEHIRSCDYCPYAGQCGYDALSYPSRPAQKVSRETMLGGEDDA